MPYHKFTKKDESDMKYFFAILVLLFAACATAPSLSGCREDCIEMKCFQKFNHNGDYVWEYCSPVCNESCNLNKY